LWTHGMFIPKEEGIKLIASSLGISEDKISVVNVRDVESIVSSQEIPETAKSLFGTDGKSLLVCMAGGTSLRVAQVLAKKGIEAESLTGGIVGLSASSGKRPPELVQIAR
jgi:cysteine synthase A